MRRRSRSGGLTVAVAWWLLRHGLPAFANREGGKLKVLNYALRRLLLGIVDDLLLDEPAQQVPVGGSWRSRCRTAAPESNAPRGESRRPSYAACCSAKGDVRADREADLREVRRDVLSRGDSHRRRASAPGLRPRSSPRAGDSAWDLVAPTARNHGIVYYTAARTCCARKPALSHSSQPKILSSPTELTLCVVPDRAYAAVMDRTATQLPTGTAARTRRGRWLAAS
jgi:hypothetical protein